MAQAEFGSLLETTDHQAALSAGLGRRCRSRDVEVSDAATASSAVVAAAITTFSTAPSRPAHADAPPASALGLGALEEARTALAAVAAANSPLRTLQRQLQGSSTNLKITYTIQVPVKDNSPAGAPLSAAAMQTAIQVGGGRW